jgi:tRNA(fMet)-specific endonuclease VapC
VNYLMDTNAVAALLRGKPAEVRDRYRAAGAGGHYLAVSSVVLFELWYGVEKTQVPQNRERLRVFLSGGLDLLAFDDEDAQAAGGIGATMEKSGTLIGPYDLLIAGQAVRRGMTVVTANTTEFARVAGLSWEDWTA